MLSSRIQPRASTEPPGLGSKPATCIELSAASATDPVPVRLGEAAGVRIAPRAIVEGPGIAVGVRPRARRLHVRAWIRIGKSAGITPHERAGIEERTPEERALDQERALDHGSARVGRSEERRVGKECRSRWSPY